MANNREIKLNIKEVSPHELTVGDVVVINHAHLYEFGVWKSWSTTIYKYVGYGNRGSMGTGEIFEDITDKHTIVILKGEYDESLDNGVVFLGKLIN